MPMENSGDRDRILKISSGSMGILLLFLRFTAINW